MDCYQLGEPLQQHISCCEHLLFHHSCIECRSMNAFFGWDDCSNNRLDISPMGEPPSRGLTSKNIPQTPNMLSQIIGKDVGESVPSFHTVKGETVRLLTKNNHAAIVEDPSCLGACFGPFPVHFSPQFLEQMTAMDCGSFLAHIIPVTGNDEYSNEKVIFVGDIGLLGGGQIHSTLSSHSCEGFATFQCATCSYTCPNKKCVKCCIHKGHTCVEEKCEKEMESDQKQSTMQNIVQDQLNETHIEVDTSHDLETEARVIQDQSIVILDTQEMEKLNKSVCVSENHSQPHREVAKNGDLPYYHHHDNFSLAVKSPLIIPVWGEVLKNLLNQSNPCSSSNSNHNPSKSIDQDIEIFTKLGEMDDENKMSKILESASANQHVKERFNALWENMENIYLVSESRIRILKQSLEHSREQSLASLCDILRASLEIEEDVLNLYESNDFSFLKLKERWLREKWTNIFPGDFEKSKIVEKLAHSFWSLEMCRIFQNHIQGEKEAELLCFLDLVLHFGTPEAVMILVLTSDITPDENGSRIGAWTNLIMFQVLCNMIHFSHKVIDNIVPHLFVIAQMSISPTVLFSFIRDHSEEIVGNIQVFAQTCAIMHNYRVSNECYEKVLEHIGKYPITDWKSETDRKIISYIFPHTDEMTTEKLIEQIVQKTEFLREDKDKLLSEYTEVTTYYNKQITNFIRVSEIRNHEGLKRPVVSWKAKEIQQWAKLVKEKKIVENIHLTIAILQRAMILHKNLKTLNPAQILALLILLQPKRDFGRLAQINTGEGKTIIVAILAAVHALRGKKVDLITSSRELAIKGAREMRGFFDMLTLKVSHNSLISGSESNLKDVYKCDVVYGTTLDFMGDILSSEFLGDDVRCGRKFDRVIVDEFDSLLYDDHMCKIRLSQRISAMNYLEPVLGEIWQYINFHGQRIVERDEKTYYIDDHYYLEGKKIILKSGSQETNKVYEITNPKNFLFEKTAEHIKKLIEKRSDEELKLCEEYQKLLQEVLKKGETLGEEERKKNKEYQKLMKTVESHPCFQYPNEHYPVLKIPSHLHEFAMNQIPMWVQNAILAATKYQKNAHYTVKDDRIIPIYFDENGELQMNLVWSDALTQFLQIREGLPMDPENFPTNYLSHVSFFKRFIPHVYGASGTAGPQATKDFLYETYAAEMVVIPPQKQRKILDNHNSPCLCKELLPIIVGNEDEWYEYVAAHALHHAKLKRAVLVICRFIFTVEKMINILSRASKDDKSLKIHAYTGVSDFKKRDVGCGDIVVATNIAGRGADFIPTFEVEKNGGLFVCITFLPKSFRVAMQNTGRTGRQGGKGMAQFILYDPQCTNIKYLIENRDKLEKETAEKAKDNVKKVILEDELFNKFCGLVSTILPDVHETEKQKMYEKLLAEWDTYFKNSIDFKDRLLHCKDRMIKKIRETKELIYGKEEANEEEKEVNEEENKELQKMVTEAETEYKKQLLEKFLYTCGIKYPADVIQCLREDKEYVCAKSELATTNNWGRFERMALEERWGIWLKESNLESKVSLTKFAEFDELIKNDAKEKSLIRNPFIFILKGNDYLYRKKSPWLWNNKKNDECLKIAIDCYNKAIELDKTFSAHARYNKACALLSYYVNIDKQLEARNELDAALEVIEKTLRPNVLAFLALVSSTPIHEKTIQHIEHQLNIIEQLENSILKAKEVLASSELGKDVQLSLVPTKKAFESYSEDHSAAIREEYANGLTHFFTLELRPPMNWRNVALLSAIGFFQIILSIGMFATGQITVGVALFCEGISDLTLAVTAIFKNSFSWGKWMAFKGVSAFVSVLFAGVRVIVSGLKCIVTTALKWIGKASVGVEVASKGIGCAVQILASPEMVNCPIEEMTKNRRIYENFEKQIFSVIEYALTKFVSESDLLAKALDLEFRKGNEYWTQIFLENISKLFKSSEFQEKESKLKNLITTEMKHSLDSGSVANISGTLKMELELFMSNFITCFEKEITIYKDQINYLQSSGDEPNSDFTAKKQTRNANLSQVARKVELIPVYQSPKEKFTYKFCSSVTQRYCSEFRKIFLKLDDIPISNLRKNIITQSGAIKETFWKFFKEMENGATSESPTYDVTENSSDQLDASLDWVIVSQGLYCFEKQAKAPIQILHWLSQLLNKPIHVFDSHTGRLIDYEENENAIDPILVKLVNINNNNNHVYRYYVPISDPVVKGSESQGSILNAVWAQLNSGLKNKFPLLTLKLSLLRTFFAEWDPNVGQKEHFQ